MNTNLMLHCKAAICTREELADSFTPEPTDTWQPIPHLTLVEEVETALRWQELRVVDTHFGLTHDGNRFFALLEIRNEEQANEYSTVIGLRNCHDKRFSAGLAVGSCVLVCDNLAFSAEVTVTRKHGIHILRDLSDLVHRAVAQLPDYFTRQDTRITAYKDKEIDNPWANDCVIDMLDNKAINATHIPRVLKEWRDPRHEDFSPRTAWSLFNCTTEILKGNSALQTRTQQLHKVFDGRLGLVN